MSHTHIFYFISFIEISRYVTHTLTLFHLLYGVFALPDTHVLCFSSFLEVLRCETHMDFLKRFLVWHASETPLMFYLAVEDMKKSKDLKQRQNKMTTVLRRFFSETHGRGEFDYGLELRLQHIDFGVIFHCKFALRKHILILGINWKRICCFVTPLNWNQLRKVNSNLIQFLKSQFLINFTQD